MSKQETKVAKTNTPQNDNALADQDLDAVSGGILSSGHTTNVHTAAGTSADDFKREAPRDPGGKVRPGRGGKGWIDVLS